MRVYKLYATGTASANNVASITFVRRGKIRAIACAASMDSTTDTAGGAIELSFQSAAFTHVNDTAGPIDQIELFNNFVTSGMSNTVVHKAVQGLDIDVGAGERLYVNAGGVVGTLTYWCTWFIYVDD